LSSDHGGKWLAPDHAFFQNAVLKGQVRHNLLEIAHLTLQACHFARRRLALGVAGQSLLAGFEELLRPGVIKTLGDPLTPAQLGDRVLAA